MSRTVLALVLSLTACGDASVHSMPDGPMPPQRCSAETDCTAAGTPYCDTSSGTCVECRFDAHCSSRGQVCGASKTCTAATTCSALHAALPGLMTGTYAIDPDGEGGDASFEVTCDMDSDGGGWTIVFHPTTDLGSTSIPYLDGAQPVVADASQVLLAYRGTSAATTGSIARFDMPAAWRTTPPFNVAGTDVAVSVAIDGGTPQAATLRYGQQNFASLCTDPWVTDSNYGRICITGTPAPYFSRFVLGAPNLCSDSNSAYNAVSCSADRRFTIAVR